MITDVYIYLIRALVSYVKVMKAATYWPDENDNCYQNYYDDNQGSNTSSSCNWCDISAAAAARLWNKGQLYIFIFPVQKELGVVIINPFPPDPHGFLHVNNLNYQRMKSRHF